MTQELEMNKEGKVLAIEQEPSYKKKRDIIRFNGERPTAINLEHVTSMYIEAKRITFEFYTKAQFIDFEDEAAATSVFEVLLQTWSSEVEGEGA